MVKRILSKNSTRPNKIMPEWIKTYDTLPPQDKEMNNLYFIEWTSNLEKASADCTVVVVIHAYVMNIKIENIMFQNIY